MVHATKREKVFCFQIFFILSDNCGVSDSDVYSRLAAASSGALFPVFQSIADSYLEQELEFIGYQATSLRYLLDAGSVGLGKTVRRISVDADTSSISLILTGCTTELQLRDNRGFCNCNM